LGAGRTVAIDNVTLTSRRYGLTGRMDRLIRDEDTVVIEEWKSSRRVWPSHRAQMGAYFILIEEEIRGAAAAWLHRLRRHPQSASNSSLEIGKDSS
jgi:hypothetical protein